MPLRFITYEYAYEISPPDPPSVEWGSSGNYGLDAHIESVHASDPKNVRYGWVLSDEYFESDPIEAGETAYVVTALWRTGDTFGSSERFTICGYKATEADADAAAILLEDADSGVPWNGYFESLLSIRVSPYVVQP